MTRRARGAACAIVVLVCSGSVIAQSPATISDSDRQVARIMLRQVRDDLIKDYYDPTFRGLDIAARFAEAEALINRAPSVSDATGVIADVLLQLDDSHTTFFPPARSTRVEYGWRMAMVGDAPLVVAVKDGSDAAAKGLAPGDLILSINRYQPARKNLWQIAYLYQLLRPQIQQHVVLRKPDGTERAVDVLSKTTNKPVGQFTDFIDDMVDSVRAVLDRQQSIGSDILVWKMPGFRDPKFVDEGIKKARRYKTLILDLRGNGGGLIMTLDALVGRVFDREVLVGTEKWRAKETKEIVRPAKDGFTGQLIVLVDSRSASAAEIFARVVQLEKRGTVIGDRTAGAVMTSRQFGHTVGVGAMAFYGASITVGDVRMSDGGSLEKVGVMPDEIALPAPEDLATDRDPVLARAVALAGGEITPEQAGALFPKTDVR
jgi:C-terminal processing protease CtpA/Prc